MTHGGEVRPWPLRRRRLIAFAALAAGLIFSWNIVLALCRLMAAALVIFLACLPISRWLEKRFSPKISALGALLLLALILLTVLLGVIPPLMRQAEQISSAMPEMIAWVQARATDVTHWLTERGLDLSDLRGKAFSAVSGYLGNLVSAAAGTIRRMAGGVSKVLLAPLVSYYLLRDRRKISALMLMAVPVRYRMQAVRAAREMRRESAGYVRGQLLLSLSVGVMTAGALALCGTPGWLLLGLMMGVMELVPYVGPVLVGVPAVLLALQAGLSPALWTLAALVAVQQVESLLLSPRLLSGATHLHPIVVLLAVMAGGMAAGIPGMVGAIPLLVSIRGAIHGWRG